MLLRCNRSLISNIFHGTSPLATRTFTSSQILLKKHVPNRKLRNYEIKVPLVQLVDQESNKLGEPTPPGEIVDKADLKHFYVELVSQDPPIVRLVNRKEAHAAKKAQKARFKQAKIEHKELQMTWNVADTDVEHKLRKAREYLSGGNLVDVAFAPKANQPGLRYPQMVKKLELVREMLKDVAEERQTRTLERNVGVVYLRPLSAAARAKEQSEEEAQQS